MDGEEEEEEEQKQKNRVKDDSVFSRTPDNLLTKRSLLQGKKTRHEGSSGAPAPALPLDDQSEKTLERILKSNGDGAEVAVAKTIEKDHKAGRSTAADVTKSRETINQAIEKLENSMNVEDAVKKGVLVNSQLLQEINGEEDTPESAVSTQEETAFEGDMMVEPSEVPALIEATRSGRMTGLNLWNNKKPIPYCFASDIKPKSKQAFIEAVKHYHDLIPCLKFIEIGHESGTSDDPNYIKKCSGSRRRMTSVDRPAIFVQSSMNSGCSSGVGSARRRNNGVVVLQLKSPGCDNRGTAAHEIGHALGMSHEQSRPDRDNYVRILWEHIKKNKEHNFRSKSLGEIGKAKPVDQPYDFLSLMHYSPTSFGVGRATTIESSSKNVEEQKQQQKLMGQRFGLTQNDAKQIASMYGCLGGQKQFKVCSIDADKCTPEPCTCHGTGIKVEKTKPTGRRRRRTRRRQSRRRRRGWRRRHAHAKCWICVKKKYWR